MYVSLWSNLSPTSFSHLVLFRSILLAFTVTLEFLQKSSCIYQHYFICKPFTATWTLLKRFYDFIFLIIAHVWSVVVGVTSNINLSTVKNKSAKNILNNTENISNNNENISNNNKNISNNNENILNNNEPKIEPCRNPRRTISQFPALYLTNNHGFILKQLSFNFHNFVMSGSR